MHTVKYPLKFNSVLLLSTGVLILIIKFLYQEPKFNLQTDHITLVILSGPRVIQLLLLDPTQVESKKSSQIQWPVPSINAEPVDIFLGEE